MNAVRTTLPGRDYWSEEVFELDRERIFFRKWRRRAADDVLAQ